MKILSLVREGSACDYHRVSLPFCFLELESGEEYQQIDDTTETFMNAFEGAKLVVLNRHTHIRKDLWEYLRRRHKFKVWVDVDDYWELYPEHYLYENWQRLKIKDKIIESMKEADIVSVTNKRLLVRVQEFNKNVVVIPNALPIGIDQFSVEKTESNKIRFMYAGGPSHSRDLAMVENLLSFIGEMPIYNDKTEFIFAGFNKRVKDKALKEMNRIMSRAPNYSTRFGLPLYRYMEHYNHCDISFCPLESNHFNIFKSNLKIIEAGCTKTPVICSSMAPYLEDKEMEGKGIYYATTYQDWMDAFVHYVKNPNLILQHGEELYNYVNRHYNLPEVNKIRRKIINSFKNNIIT